MLLKHVNSCSYTWVVSPGSSSPGLEEMENCPSSILTTRKYIIVPSIYPQARNTGFIIEQYNMHTDEVLFRVHPVVYNRIACQVAAG